MAIQVHFFDSANSYLRYGLEPASTRHPACQPSDGPMHTSSCMSTGEQSNIINLIGTLRGPCTLSLGCQALWIMQLVSWAIMHFVSYLSLLPWRPLATYSINGMRM